MPDARPNLLVIMSDQHHAGVLGAAGDRLAHTPHLDRLAAGGVRATNCYCPSPLCGPSRMSFMTARHPYDNALWTNEEELSSDSPTFAHGLLAAGYETVLSGRMHFVGHDQRHGFLARPIGDVPESAYLSAGWQLARVLGELRDTPGTGLQSIVKSGPGRMGYHAYDEAVTRTTVDWLRARATRAAPEPRPFLLVVGYAAPHCPFVCPPEDFALHAARIKVSDLPPTEGPLHPFVGAWRRANGAAPAPPIDAQWRARVAYYGLCTFLDRQVGAVLDALAATGLAENTVVVYTSDHGENLGEHGLWWKMHFYDSSTRVPLLVNWPGRLDAGRVVTPNVSLIDIGPTLLGMAGAPPLPGVSGRDLAPLLRGQADGWDDTVFAEYANLAGATSAVAPRRMVKSGPWKYNYYHGYRPELYNLADDPQEMHDRWDDPTCADVRARLHARLRAGWDPEVVEQHLQRCAERRRLIAAWVRAAKPPEPDPLWFDTPPVNEWTQPGPPA